jgi:hypothetical protein
MFDCKVIVDVTSVDFVVVFDEFIVLAVPIIVVDVCVWLDSFLRAVKLITVVFSVELNIEIVDITVVVNCEFID